MLPQIILLFCFRCPRTLSSKCFSLDFLLSKTKTKNPTLLHMFSESAHLAAKLQKDFLSSSSSASIAADVSGSQGTPNTIIIDRNLSSSLQKLIQSSLSLDQLGLSSKSSSVIDNNNHRHHVFNETFKDSLSYAMFQLSKSLNEAVPQIKNVRRQSSIPQSIQATCNLLEAVDVVVNSINDKFLHTATASDVSVSVSSSQQRKQQTQKETSSTNNTSTSRPSSASSKTQMMKNVSAVVAVEKNNSNSRPPSARRSAAQEKVDSSTSNYQHHQQRHNGDHDKEENEILRKELRRMKEREEILLKKVRDLEIDCRVKAHTVASTTASAQAVFDENTILRQIAEHNQSLLKEVDALSRCVAENETLHMEISSKEKAMQSAINKSDEMQLELRKLRNEVHELRKREKVNSE